MKIEINNKITIDNDVEEIKEVYDCQISEKAGFLYFVYQNPEKEKVVLKCYEKGLTMTRYSTPKSLMKFHRDQKQAIAIPTPLGLQHFVTDTNSFHFSKDLKELSMNYDLRDATHDGLFASYSLNIKWY
ncbi:DUF1934 domain-containing protein [Streptococcus catagoni]|uniref:DUF1934 domain-containing protein n=1 Tax=Streptococcus catagoni TaxID=2654874 RepID=UPI00140D6BD0|nr:DUF1934 domain-containing protein [Streptococcus catagoni]